MQIKHSLLGGIRYFTGWFRRTASNECLLYLLDGRGMLNAAQYPTGAAKPWLTSRYFYSFMLCAKPHVLHKYGLKGFMCTSRAIRGMLCTHCSHTPPITLLLATHSTPTASLKVPCIPPE